MKDTDRFVRTLKQSSFFGGGMEVWVDTATGVNYITWVNGYAGGLTVMLDADGKPVVTPVDEYGRII